MITFDSLGSRGVEYNHSFKPREHSRFELFASYLNDHPAIVWTRYAEDPYDMYDNRLVYIAGPRCWHYQIGETAEEGSGWKLYGLEGAVLKLPYKIIRDVVPDEAQETFAVNVSGGWFELTGLIFARALAKQQKSRAATLYG